LEIRMQGTAWSPTAKLTRSYAAGDRLLDIPLGLLAHIMFHGPELSFLVCIRLHFGPKPYRSWRQTLGADNS